MSSLTESNKRSIKVRFGCDDSVKKLEFVTQTNGDVAVVTFKDGTTKRFETREEWNDWHNAEGPRIPVGFNPFGN